jgi:porin
MRRFKSSLLSACVLLTATAVSPAYAETAAAPMGTTQGVKPFSQAIKAEDETSPYQLKLQYTGELWDNAAGGIQTGTAYMQNVDAQMRIDADKGFGWKGGRIFLEGYYESSRSMAPFVGAVQDASVIDTEVTTFLLYQAYYDQNLGDTDLLLGIYDMQNDFGSTRPMDIFFNGGYAWTTTLDASGQQGLNGRSQYPFTTLGFRAKHTINDQWEVLGAVFDGMVDNVEHPGVTDLLINKKYGVFGIGQVNYTPIPRTKIMAGAWGYTGKFETQNEVNADDTPRQVYGSVGGYVGGATRLYTQEGKRGLDGFANIGFADPVVNQIDRSVNMGLTYTGLLDARPNDKLGLAMTIAGAGDPYRKAQTAEGNATDHYETNFELTYRAPITSWLTIQPDVQYWINPGLDPTKKDDFLVGVHFEIGHLFNL